MADKRRQISVSYLMSCVSWLLSERLSPVPCLVVALAVLHSSWRNTDDVPQ